MSEKEKRQQTASAVFMVKPLFFGYNDETAVNNRFQQREDREDPAVRAVEEQQAFAALLRHNGIRVLEAADTPAPHTPDSVFPNNWFSTHEDGTLVLYPMFAKNRRAERKPEFLKTIREGFSVRRTVDLTPFEKEGRFLEGTGSMVLDRLSRVAYACRSPRTDGTVLREFCDALGYAPFLFSAADRSGAPIYHTNVMMCAGTDFSAVCADAVPDPAEREALLASLEENGKTPLLLSFSQMEHFAGNMLELRGGAGERFLVLSDTALSSLDEEQKDFLRSRCTLLSPAIPCIEKNGGGSARCMLAEIY